MPATQMTPAQQAAVINAQARAAIKANAVKMQQGLTSVNIVPAANPVLNVQPRNVGLLLGFWVGVNHTISNGSGVTINLTDFGPQNALGNITFNDYNNVTRITTSGRHLSNVNSVRARRPLGCALVRTTGIDCPTDFGSNWVGQVSAPATIAASATGNVIQWYWVPLAYSDDDLRGTIYANIVNATAQLLLTMPQPGGPTPIAVAAGTDSTNAMYIGATSGSVAAVSITNTAVQVYQYYYDQLPSGPNGLLLPITDMGVIYEMKETKLPSITSAADFGYQYSNFRNIMGTTVIYVQAAATGARGVGADINYFGLQAANLTFLWKKAPDLLAMEFRNFFQTDMPPGQYYFGSRARPIITTQYGNMQLVINPITAGTGAYMYVGIEDFALIQTLSMAGSLPTS